MNEKHTENYWKQRVKGDIDTLPPVFWCWCVSTNILTALYSYCRLRAVTSAMVPLHSSLFYRRLFHVKQPSDFNTHTRFRSLVTDTLQTSAPRSEVKHEAVFQNVPSFSQEKCVSHTLQRLTANTSAHNKPPLTSASGVKGHSETHSAFYRRVYVLHRQVLNGLYA